MTVVEDDAFAPLRLARNSLCIAITYASEDVFACCRGGTPLQQSSQGQVGVSVGVCLFASFEVVFAPNVVEDLLSTFSCLGDGGLTSSGGGVTGVL